MEEGPNNKKSSYAQLRYVSQIALAKLFAVDVFVDIDGFSPHVTPQLLDEFAGHTGPSEVGREPVAATVKREMVLHPVGVGIMKPYPSGRNCYGDGRSMICQA